MNPKAMGLEELVEAFKLRDELGRVNERYLSPVARRRREIVADIECAISFAAGALCAAVVMLIAGIIC